MRRSSSGLAADSEMRIDMLVDAHQREAQIGFPGIAVRRCRLISGLADPVAQQRGRAGIDDRRPDHVAGDGE